MENKKTVAYLTRHTVSNYGSVLQAYATQTALEKLGCNAVCINYFEILYMGVLLNLNSNLSKKRLKQTVAFTHIEKDLSAHFWQRGLSYFIALVGFIIR